MADTKTSALTVNTAPLITDRAVLLDDPSGTPDLQTVALSNLLQFYSGLTEDTSPTTDAIIAYLDDVGGTPVVRKINLNTLGSPAHKTLMTFPANAMIGDQNAQLVAGDASAIHSIFNSRPILLFDDTNEEAAITPEVTMPGQYSGGTLTCDVHYFMVSDATNDIAIDVFVEAKTPNSDTLDLETAASWDSANSGTQSLAGTTAGDPLKLSITLTNADSVAAGDLVRFGVRRDCDSGNDDATGDLVLAAIEIWEVS